MLFDQNGVGSGNSIPSNTTEFLGRTKAHAITDGLALAPGSNEYDTIQSDLHRWPTQRLDRNTISSTQRLQKN